MATIALFAVTIVIGILNGADAVEFDHNQILTHVHAGTVGWLTLVICCVKASQNLSWRLAFQRPRRAVRR